MTLILTLQYISTIALAFVAAQATEAEELTIASSSTGTMNCLLAKDRWIQALAIHLSKPAETTYYAISIQNLYRWLHLQAQS